MKILRLPQVCERTGLSKTRVYQRIRSGAFPETVELGANSVGWYEHEVDEWIVKHGRRSPSFEHSRARLELGVKDRQPLPEILARFGSRLRAYREPAPVVYVLMLCGVPVYVGQTTNLEVRLKQHRGGRKVFDEVRFINCRRSDAEALEQELIAALNPRYNRAGVTRIAGYVL